MPSQITQLLRAWSGGDPGALGRLTPLVYQQLRRLAANQMRKERPGHLLQTTALVNEAYLRLVKIDGFDWRDRGHFFAVAARILRHVLVDGARQRLSAKRGGEVAHVAHAADIDFDQLPAPATDRPAELCALDLALTSLAQLDPRRAQVVEMRFFGGLTVEETAAALDVSAPTVMRDWRLARAWLTRELGGRLDVPSSVRAEPRA
ncbi:MAG: sigma-70 family RNA polymerase sigma factor [Vicinamibacteraceae bacterium]